MASTQNPADAARAAAAGVHDRFSPAALAELEARVRALSAAARAAVLERGVSALGDFEAARPSRTRPNRNARRRGGSADSHRDRQTRHELRKQCQSLLRNDKLARSLVRRLKQFVVGDAVGVQVRSADKGFNRAAERFLSAWAESCEHSGQPLPGGGRGGRGLVELSACALHAAMQDGAAAVLVTDEGYLQWIEDERVMNPPGRYSDPLFADGVEFTADGRMKALHIAEWGAGGTQPRPTTREVPASSVLYLPSPTDDQPNLTRPEPGLCALIKDLDQVRKYSESVAIAATMATYFGLVIKSNYPGDVSANLPGATVQAKADADGGEYGQKQNELGPAFVLPLEPNEDAMQIDPKQPTQTYSDYLVTNLAMIGAEGGVPLVLWLLDFRQVNFHSARSAVLLMGIIAAVWRRWLESRLLGPACRWRLAREIKAGGLEDPETGRVYGLADVPDGWDRLEFIFPPMPVVDPKDQYAAEQLAMNAGFKTLGDIIRQMTGRDPEEHEDELAAEKKRLRAKGIMPTGMPGQKDPNQPDAGADPAGEEDDDDEAADDDDNAGGARE